MTEKDEKFFEKKKNRREFLNKAGIGGAGLALGLSGASAFFAPKLTSQEKISYGNENQDKEDQIFFSTILEYKVRT